jgi:photosystem II stability/assembly factor-like uncharacterized protein
MIRRVLFSFVVLTLVFSCKEDPQPSVLDRSDWEAQQALYQSSPYKNLQWRAIGPDVISGRVTDVIGIPGDTNIMYAAYATSGVWKTIDAGKSWKPIFDEQSTLSIGDIALAPSDPNVLYVGTGEANIFRASLPGRGLFRSSDAGKTFQSAGLENTGTIARIIVHPTDPKTVWVAAGGKEWIYNEDRGVYKTTDGGTTWTKVLYQNEKTGCIDLVIDPTNPEVLYASMWNRIRRRYSDPIPEDGDMLYKSLDGGKTWKSIAQGLPSTAQTGRIGLAISPSQPNTLYAFVDDHNIKRQPEANETDSYERKVQKVVIGGAIYRSDDGGATWNKRGEVHDFFKPFSGTYGWVFSQIRVHPTRPDEIYALGVSLGHSIDGGKTWKKIEPKTHIHGDNHGMWFDPTNPSRIILGNDGGVSITYDGGKNWRNFFDKMQTTQFYTISYDMAQPFNVLGSVQDEGTWSANVMHKPGDTTSTHRKWSYAPGGEGTQIRVDPRNENIVFSCTYYGRLMKSNMAEKVDSLKYGKIKLFDVGRIDSLRGEWLAGTIISRHNPDVIYHGLQHLYKSYQRRPQLQ